MPTNIMQLLGLMRQGGNPQQLVMSLLEQQSNGNPFFQNLLTLAKNNDTRGIETVARNIAKERGVDFDTAFNSFKNNLGL